MGSRGPYSGFTLMEITITVVIIGIMATIGLPKYALVVEKARVSEAKAILSNLRDAQVRYLTQENHFTNVPADLDAQPMGMKYFTVTIAGTVTTEAAGALQTTEVAVCSRNNVQNINGYPVGYDVRINQQGTISSTNVNVQGRLL